jgi:hypothetical protein
MEDTHMADLPPYSTPRWVKVFGIIVIVLVLLFVVVLVTGLGGEHGPGRHMPSSDAPPPSVIQDYTPFDGGPGGHTPTIEHGVQQL